MLQLLGRSNSSNVMKVIWLLEEMGLPYDRKDVGGKFGGNDTPEYLAMNPNGVVPTIVGDGFVLWESNAILRYLAAAHPAGHKFWPQDLRARANVDRWMDWQQTTLGAPMTVVFWGLVRTAPEQRDMDAIHSAAAKLGHLYGMLDRVLADSAFIGGPELTVCDMSIGVHAHRYFSFEGIERPEQHHLRAWYDRLLSRPAYKQHVAGPMS
ncbi:MAG: glutathione S-transferase family protein [Acetobacteraceae bacterium]|nr:glutathione S-transferase family protein [Acetobacteraceae bacterium]